jgi:hypothetical protein
MPPLYPDVADLAAAPHEAALAITQEEANYNSLKKEPLWLGGKMRHGN